MQGTKNLRLKFRAVICAIRTAQIGDMVFICAWIRDATSESGKPEISISGGFWSFGLPMEITERFAGNFKDVLVWK